MLLLTFTYRKQNKKSLIFLPHTIIHPWAVVIHLSNTSFANTKGKEERHLLRNNDLDFEIEIQLPKDWIIFSWQIENSDFATSFFKVMQIKYLVTFACFKTDHIG